MIVYKKTFKFKTKAAQEIFDLSPRLREALVESGVKEGIALLFVPGSTAGVTTIEFEPGALADLRRAISRLAPEGERYEHDNRWGDGNGFSHVRAALMGPSIAIPISGGTALNGTWQQPVLCDFDNKPRERELIITILGE